ncbi:GDP-fucose protein O-fucosyltransferase 2-like isoform X2 [Amphiura filiformis]|uniref:GDP-fucose protein O-fucosyltransferase 2-like isoform X2 n=1 Tax=Amphiura filiformis TaxID=82378 RepID=UPI003B21BE47
MATSMNCTRWLVFTLYILFLTLFLSVISLANAADDIVFQSGNQQKLNVGVAKARRFLLYDVNPGEGFNLRRDVYMRMANLVGALGETEDWTLVLPPWGRIYHWQNRHLDQVRIPWSTFFDVPSLNRHIPVIELEEYIKIRGKPEIDQILYLQSYKEGWSNGKFEEKVDERDCIDRPMYQKDSDGLYRGWFWGYEEVYAKAFKCVSIQGFTTTIAPVLINNVTATSVFLDRGEKISHKYFGQAEYWKARRSMRFAKHLTDIGDDFRRGFLNSDDKRDKTEVTEDWRDMRRDPGSATGGPYIAVHLRRQDYARGGRKDVPTLQAAAEHVEGLLKKLKLKIVFLATDAPKREIDEFKKYLSNFKVVNYVPPKVVLEKYMDGGVAIIDQWICAHARYFIGTGVSTFTFRINEERQILGFDPKMTYNRFCGHAEEPDCEQPSAWKIVY